VVRQERVSGTKTNTLTILCIFIFFIILGFITPLTGDDWTWGSSIGLHRLSTGYVGYNGRVVSNTLEVLISRYALIRVPLYAIINMLLIIFTAKIIAGPTKTRSWHYLAATGFFLTISTTVYAQSFGWFAGFINYVFGTFIIFSYYYWITRVKPTTSMKTKWLIFIGMFIWGLISALIIEHVTIYLLCLSAGSLVYLRKQGFKSHLNWSYFIGLIIGSLTMFLNPSYIRIFTGHDTLRHTAQNGLIDQGLTMYTNQMAKFIFQQNGLLLLTLSIGIIVLIYRSNHGNTLLKSIVSFYLLSYSVFAAFIRNLFPIGNFDIRAINQYLALASVLYIISLVIAVTNFIREDNLSLRLWFYIISALLLSAPFIVITPYGPRCAFNTISFMILATIDIINTIIIDSSDKIAIPNVFKLFGIFAMVLMTVTMGMNGYVNHTRKNAIQIQLNQHASKILVRRLPFEQFVWDSSPAKTRFQYTMYKRRMKISAAQKLTFVPYAKWHNIK